MMTSLAIGRALSTGAVVALLFAGCSGADDPKAGNGVNDVRAACEIRARWNRTENDCSLCESGVISPRCECESLKAFSGMCLDQENARKSACAQGVVDCVFKCDRTDCACIDACYTNGDACKAASAARDGCMTEACSQYCK